MVNNSDKLQKLIEIVNTALQSPGKSKLTESQFDVGGFISPNVRHLYNNVASLATHYFELGSHIGSSLVSSVYGNDNLKSATACDNFSLFSEGQDAKAEFYKNADRHINGKYKMLEKDGFKLTKKDLPNSIDLYLKDGDHSYESEYLGVTKIAPFLADESIMLVDDFSWAEVQQGTWDGIRDAKLNVAYCMILWSGIDSDCGDRGFWNGTACFYLKKSK